MTKEEAININEEHLTAESAIGNIAKVEALRLGIEALKRISVAREHAGYAGSYLLLGETKK